MDKDQQDYETIMSKARRIQIQAAAILGRANDAGIPKEFQRINKETFASFLEPMFIKQKFNQTTEQFADTIFGNPDGLLNKRFIILDGGGAYSNNRMAAGFALLFRMIACDKTGTFQQGDKLINILNTFDKLKGEFVEELQEPDILLIGNISIYGFSPNMGGGKYLDEILESRMLNGKQTIISFTKPVFVREGGNDGTLNDERAGRYLLQLCHADVPSMQREIEQDMKTLRIRVK